MRILITGAAGFIGYRLANNLIKDGHTVVGVDRNPFKIHGAECIMKDVQIYLNELKTITRLPIIQSMLIEPADQFDLIIHLAATARLGISLEKPDEVIANNIGTTLQVLSYARSMPGTRVIFVSSGSVKCADTTTNPYALSKKMCEDMVSCYRDTFGVDATIVRLFNVYGPGETNYGKNSTLIRKCTTAISTGSKIPLYGSGEHKRDYTHVDDTVDALMILSNMLTWNNLYEVGSGKNPMSTKEIVMTFCNALGTEIDYLPARSGDPLLSIADASKNPPGWVPKWTLPDYLDELISSFKHSRLIKSNAA